MSDASIADAADFFDSLDAASSGVMLPQYTGSGTPTAGYVLTANGAGVPPSWQAGGGGGGAGWYYSGPITLAHNESTTLNIGPAAHPVVVAGVSEQVTAQTGLTRTYTYSSTYSAQFTELSPSSTEFTNSALRLTQTSASSPIILLHFNNESGDSTFYDACGRTVTRSGDPTLETSPSGYFGNACGYFDGSSDYLAIASHADFAYGSSDLTVQFRVYMSSAQGERTIMFKQGVELIVTVGASTVTDWSSSGSTLGIHVYYDNTSWGLQLAGTTSLADSTWHHVAITRSGSTWKIYVDGTLQSSATYSRSIAAANINIGGQAEGGRTLNGYLDQVAVNTSLIYNGNFTPPADQLNYIAYPSGSYYCVKPADGYYLSLAQVSLVTGLVFQQTVYTLTGILWLYTTDGGVTWKNHGGSTVDPADIGTSGSTAAQMSTLFTNWTPPSGGTELGLMCGLYAQNFTLTPQVWDAVFTYNGPVSWQDYINGSRYQILKFVSESAGSVQVTRLVSGSSTIYVWAQNGNS